MMIKQPEEATQNNRTEVELRNPDGSLYGLTEIEGRPPVVLILTKPDDAYRVFHLKGMSVRGCEFYEHVTADEVTEVKRLAGFHLTEEDL